MSREYSAPSLSFLLGKRKIYIFWLFICWDKNETDTRKDGVPILRQPSSHFTEQGLSLPLRQLMGPLVLMCKSREDLRGVGQLHKTGTLPQCKLAGGKSPPPPLPPTPQEQRGAKEANSQSKVLRGWKTARREASLACVKLLAGQHFSGVSGHGVLKGEKKEKKQKILIYWLQVYPQVGQCTFFITLQLLEVNANINTLHSFLYLYYFCCILTQLVSYSINPSQKLFFLSCSAYSKQIIN